jgi:radical SAM superfamily enzyme YgiQ (UPF0313 family)
MIRQDTPPIDALLVGYENQENLGLRSIVAYLQAHAYRAALAPFFPGRGENVLAAVRRYQPRLVGFSLIFQYTLDEFGKLMRYLRANSVSAHFTAGGHFPSLRPRETLELLPELDSVVCFEGELTLPELLDHLHRPHRWSDIQGLAFRQNGQVLITPPRPLIDNLDELPLVYRDEPQQSAGGLRMASMLASRGCLFNCSFCSIRQFYGGTAGPLRRVRSPQAVVDEMRALFTDKGVRLFIFQDDDFAARSIRQQEWLAEFLAALARAGLTQQVRWKISCRVDDLEPKSLARMLDHGLAAVYLGVESGSETGLHTLNKQVSVAQNRAAIDLLKRYEVALAIGFMLFDPSSTVVTVRENLEFLRAMGQDGYFPINFCKMLPYAGTPIETQLRAAGRLKGSVTRPDYNFADPQLDWYAFLVQRIFSQRNFNPDGLVVRLQQADFDYHLARTFGCPEFANGYGAALRQLTSRANSLALDTLEALLNSLVARGAEALLEERETLLALTEHEWRGEAAIEIELAALRQHTGIHSM